MNTSGVLSSAEDDCCGDKDFTTGGDAIPAGMVFCGREVSFCTFSADDA